MKFEHNFALLPVGAGGLQGEPLRCPRGRMRGGMRPRYLTPHPHKKKVGGECPNQALNLCTIVGKTWKKARFRRSDFKSGGDNMVKPLKALGS